MDMIIRPEDFISKAEVYFKNNEENKPLNVVGHVVNEKMLFYKIIPRITNEAKPFSIDELIIP
jgi:phosphoglycerol transferase MdoB-like AlkP superfamily enzyme